jgi:hypothetical protein
MGADCAVVLMSPLTDRLVVVSRRSRRWALHQIIRFLTTIGHHVFNP